MTKIGIFGGTFNPLHCGHVNSAKTVVNRLNLDQMFVVPAFQSPLAKKTYGPLPEQRFEMVQSAFEGLDKITVDRREVDRQGVSYTLDTVNSFSPLDHDIYLVVGLDQFENFDRWHRFEDILSLVNIVVTSRPGLHFPQSIDEFPEGTRSFIEKVEPGSASILTGKTIQFLQLDDLDISATEIRTKLRKGIDVSELVPEKALDYIRKNELYAPLSTEVGDYKKFTTELAHMLAGKNAQRLMAFDLSKMVQPSEYTVIGSGTSTRHTGALADFLAKEVKKKYGILPIHIEGTAEGRWVVLDYGGVLVHLFYDYVRQQYNLEELWRDGDEIPLDLPVQRLTV